MLPRLSIHNLNLKKLDNFNTYDKLSDVPENHKTLDRIYYTTIDNKFYVYNPNDDEFTPMPDTSYMTGYYTKGETNDLLSQKQNLLTTESTISIKNVFVHDHLPLTDDELTSKHYVDAQTYLKADKLTTYTKSNVDDLLNNHYTKTETNNLISEKQNILTTTSEIATKNITVEDLIPVYENSVTSKHYVDDKILSEISTKANIVDVYTKTETNSLLNNKANTADVYTKPEVYTKAETDALVPVISHANYNMPGYYYAFPFRYYRPDGSIITVGGVWSNVFRIFPGTSTVEVNCIVRFTVNDSSFDGNTNPFRTLAPFQFESQSEASTSDTFGTPQRSMRGNTATCFGGIWNLKSINFVSASNYMNSGYFTYMNSYTIAGDPNFILNTDVYNRTVQIQFSITYQAKTPLTLI